MGDAAQLYAPVLRDDDGAVDVVLGADHPGFSDPAYRRRRNALAALALDWRPGDPVPEPEYSGAEHAVWRAVARRLEPLHAEHACRAYLEAKEELGLPADRVPQLPEVTGRLAPLTGFSYLPVAGLAPLRDFYGAFARSVFFSTQYLRHPSMPLYTPEPDIVHEVVGHANQLASPSFAPLYRLVGEAVARTRTDEALRFLSRVFWFSLEFGVVDEGGVPKAYGAGILSSPGETAAFRGADLRPLDAVAMGTLAYDITRYQPVLFAARSMAHLVDFLSELFSTFDDDAHARLPEGATP
ncbi:MAG TPA: phenylalanine 4-monooxygenase [Acidimicrobiales bacterium]|nr:phenylalanine 4-monooxygenase [Acidimicrobiales bacterium]